MDEQQGISVVASSSNSSKKYDVFLSFRGEDTRMNFTSVPYNALTEAKIETYMDNQLEKGHEISPALTKAIKDSHISVVIFSENYASSKWCLNELSKIMEFKKERGQIVIPIFHNIDPSHVRNQTGSYEQAFVKHEREPMYNKWKATLTEAANLAGWDSRNRIHSELLKDIVQDVLKKLALTYPNQRKRLVRIEECHEEIQSLLKIGSNEVITLGIWGMGGIGKTTLAQVLYDKFSYKFEGFCFLSNVREKSEKLEALRDKLFSKLMENKNQGFDYFDLSKLRCKKVFVVLDDVSTSEQLEKLIGEYDFLGAGSRVIITTRDRQVLSTVNEIHPIEGLNSHHSLQLFCLTVFGDEKPKHGYEDLSRRVISYCKGVPLALKVLGASLRNRSKEAWESELRKLQKIPNMKIHNVLKLSYDGLDRSEKDIFLDIACFFKGIRRDKLTELLEVFDFFPASGIEILLDKALITISDDNRVEMHDLIQEMGQEIVHQESEKYPGKRSRLWKHEEVLDVLKYNKGTDVVEGIILNFHKLKGDLYLNSDSLAKMTNLRYLTITGAFMWDEKFNVYLSIGLESFFDKLRYLCWGECCLESLPPNFCGEQLVELYMPGSNVKKLWDGIQNFANLKIIDLSYSRNLIEIPDLSKAEKLEKVVLVDCENLHRLHRSLFFLPKLTYLYLSGCRKIESLISNIHSKSLYELSLDGCSSLKEFSMTSENMTYLKLSRTAISALSSSIGELLSLEELDLSGSSVESLPSSIKNLSRLKRLRLDGCTKLMSLSSIGHLLSLEELDLSGTNVDSFPANIKNLLRLKRLRLGGCKKLMSLSSSVSHLLSLEELDVSGTDIQTLPENIKSLSRLTRLWLNGCTKLVSLPELPASLRELYINGCWELVG